FADVSNVRSYWFRRRLFDGRQNQLSATLFQDPLHRRGEVHQQMETVGDLLRCGAPSVAPSAYRPQRSREMVTISGCCLSQAEKLSAARSGSRSRTRCKSRFTRIVP